MKAEVTPTDAASRGPLLVLIFSGILWLLIAGALALVASIQAREPAFLSECELVTYGRMVPMAETAFVYGWLANIGLAVALWVLGRLSAEPLRAQNWAILGAVFWNLGVTGAVAGIALGHGTGYPLLGLPGYVHLILFVSYGAMALPGILAWSGRLREMSFASHWYGVAGLFVFPWLLSIAHVMLFAAPVRGVLQAVTADWFAQSAWYLWLAPLALSAAYYVVPKVTGRAIPSYEFAALGFWCVALVGGLTAGHRLIGGPVPAWIPSVAVVSGVLVLFHVAVVNVNLRGIFGARGIAAKFIGFGLIAYTLGALAETVSSFHPVSVQTQFTFFEDALRQITLYGAASTFLLGGLYFALPRITGQAWASAGLVRAHLLLTVVGILLLVASLAGAGLIQGADLLNPKVDFPEIAAHLHGWLFAASVAEAALLFGNALLFINLCATVWRLVKPLQPAVFEAPAIMENSAR